MYPKCKGQKKQAFSIGWFVFGAISALSMILYAVPNGQMDLNSDGLTNQQDLELFAQNWLIPQDPNELTSSAFDLADFSELSSTWLNSTVPLMINEFLASNQNLHFDDQGQDDDWIEIYNYGQVPLDLGGMYLTDNLLNPTKWQIPTGHSSQTAVAPNDFILIWADNDPQDGPLHLGFKLSSQGEDIGLFASDGLTLIDHITSYPVQTTNKSYGRLPSDPNNLFYFDPPTPSVQNSSAFAGLVSELIFSHSRGFYNQPFQLSLANSTSGTVIYYTTDGSEPDETSLVYNNGIQINTTTVIKAIATKTGYLPSEMQTHSYLFLNDVISQPATIPGYANNIYDLGGGGSAVHDYEMDPDIVNDPNYSTTIITGLQAIPTMSITVDPSEIFGNSGFYDGTDQEKKAFVEVLYAHNPSRNHFANTGIESHSHKRLKRSMRLNFRSIYGDSNFDTDLFETAPLNGALAEDKVDRLILRAGNNRSWARNWNPNETCYTTDQFYRDCQIAMSGSGAHGTFVHLYINGLYWGLYNAVERPDHFFAESYFGGDRNDWHARNHGNFSSGNDQRYNYLTQTLANQDMTDPNAYAELEEYLDVDHYIDYLILNWWASVSDWPGNNWYASNRSNTSPLGATGLKYFAWDGEWSWNAPHGSVNNPDFQAWVHPDFRDGQTSNLPIAKLWHALRQNEDFMTRFSDRAYQHLFHEGPLAPGNAQTSWQTLNNYISEAVIAESARWGDALESLGQPTRTKQQYWQTQVDTMHNLISTNREFFIDALRTEMFYPTINAPEFNQRGGNINSTFEISLNASGIDPNDPGVIYYTLDGNDPRLPEGNVNTISANEYTTPFTLSQSSQIIIRYYKETEWSARNETFFIVSP